MQNLAALAYQSAKCFVAFADAVARAGPAEFDFLAQRGLDFLAMRVNIGARLDLGRGLFRWRGRSLDAVEIRRSIMPSAAESKLGIGDSAAPGRSRQHSH